MIDKTVLIYDRGLYTFRAEEFAKVYKTVKYFKPDSRPYPDSIDEDMATDLKGVKRIYSFWDALKELDKDNDWIYFPDCYDGDFQTYLTEQGYAVFGEHKAGELEMDKEVFYNHLEEVGLPVPFTFIAYNLDECIEYLEDKEDKWLKPANSFARGDFETYHFVNMNQAMPWFNHLKGKLGMRCSDLKILIQDPVEAVCEFGYDGFSVDGVCLEGAMGGYEIKDKGIICRVFPETPKIVKSINDKLCGILGEKGCQGHWSTELRITKKGVAYFIDPTLRSPSPPGELFDVMYKNYPEACEEIARGRVPKLEMRHRYGTELMLYSAWYEEHELCVEFPKEIAPYVKLKNHNRRGDCYYCTPNDNDGYFGAIVFAGESVKQCTKKVMEMIGKIKAAQLEYDSSTFDKAEEQIKGGEAFGIHF